jgi:hypothetical protein
LRLRLCRAIVGFGLTLEDIADHIVSLGLRFLPEPDTERVEGSPSLEGVHSGSNGDTMEAMYEDFWRA